MTVATLGGFEFLKLVDRKRPRWVVWENVPGVLLRYFPRRSRSTFTVKTTWTAATRTPKTGRRHRG